MKMNELDKIQETMAEEARKAEETAAMKAVAPKTILDMIQDVYDGKLLIISDDNDNIIGINCPVAVKGVANTKKIGDHMVMGSDEANLKEDEIALKQFMKAYEGQNIMHMFYAALKVQKAGLHPECAEMINGIYYFCINSLKKVIDEDGKTVVDFSKEKGAEGIDSEFLTKILKDELYLIIQGDEDYWESIGYYDEDFED